MFNLDPKLADEVENTDILPELEMDAHTPFHGSYVDAFPALRSGSHLAAPPGLGYPRSSSRPIFDPVPNRLGVSSVTPDKLSNYMGSFNPFSDAPESSASSSPSLPSPSLPFDEERKVSRFGFARGRQSSSLASSPLNGPSHVPLGEMNGLHGSGDDHSPPGPPPGLSQLRWESQSHEYGNSQPPSIVNSPHIPSQMAYAPQSRFQPFDSVSEAQLREFIQASQEREYQKQVSGLFRFYSYLFLILM
jgi:CCR4-NOT transcription complex subunit 4